MTRAAVCALMVAAAIVTSPVVVKAASSPAERFDDARRLFDAGHYAEAAEMFTLLHAETGDPAVLYPIAQSLRLAGRCAEALAAYRGFVAASTALRARALAAGVGSDVKRVASDLSYAQGRIVEMRVCAGRATSETARREAQERLTHGDGAAAIGVLALAWDTTKDPTLLPELAEVQRSFGSCPEGITLLSLTIDEILPIEALGEVEQPGSDLAAALQALRQARAGKRDARCGGPGMAANAMPATVPLAPPASRPADPRSEPDLKAAATGVPARAAARWPLWAASGGAALVLAGGVSWLLMYQTTNQVEALRSKGWDEAEGRRLLDRGDRYQLGGYILTTTGAIVGTSAMIYYFFFAKKSPPAAVPELRVSDANTTLVWTGRF